jgi:hypothetical protein
LQFESEVRVDCGLIVGWDVGGCRGAMKMERDWEMKFVGTIGLLNRRFAWDLIKID